MSKAVAQLYDGVARGLAHMSDDEALAHLLRAAVADDTREEPVTNEQIDAWWNIEAPVTNTIEQD